MFNELDRFSELDRALGIDYNLNLWFDDAIFYVRTLINGLDRVGWDQLRSEWRVRPISWQVRLAQAAFAANDLRAIDVLRDMLRSSNVQVALAAAETLNEEVIDERWVPTDSTKEDLQRLLRFAEGEAHQTIKSLIARTPEIARSATS